MNTFKRRSSSNQAIDKQVCILYWIWIPYQKDCFSYLRSFWFKQFLLIVFLLHMCYHTIIIVNLEKAQAIIVIQPQFTWFETAQKNQRFILAYFIEYIKLLFVVKARNQSNNPNQLIESRRITQLKVVRSVLRCLYYFLIFILNLFHIWKWPSKCRNIMWFSSFFYLIVYFDSQFFAVSINISLR